MGIKDISKIKTKDLEERTAKQQMDSAESRNRRLAKREEKPAPVEVPAEAKRGVSVLFLKVVVCISMVFDHIGLMVLQENTTLYHIFRGVGRMAFPLVAFLLVEGFFHTKNRFKYGARLLIFGLLSEPIYVFMGMAVADKYHTYENSLIMSSLTLCNTILTLFICYLMLVALSKTMFQFWKQKQLTSFQKVMKLTAVVAIFVCFAFITYLFSMDYYIVAPLYVLIFFYFYEDTSMKLLVGVLLVLTQYSGDRSLALNLIYMIGGIIPFLLIKKYNGERGYSDAKKPIAQYGFYLFYPFHIAVIVLIAFYDKLFVK